MFTSNLFNFPAISNANLTLVLLFLTIILSAGIIIMIKNMLKEKQTQGLFLFVIPIPIIIIVLYIIITIIYGQLFVSEADVEKRNRLFVNLEDEPKTLNPLVSTHHSHKIIFNRIFNSLFKYDETFSLTGDLAESWEEEEYFYFYFPLDKSKISTSIMPDRNASSTISIRNYINQIKGKKVSPHLKLIKRIEINHEDIKYNQIRIVLSKVDPGFFTELKNVLGPDFFEHTSKEIGDKKVFQHNPVITIKLKEGIKFHDDMELTAKDVKYTLEKIQEMKNPALPNLENVKKIEIIDKLKFKIVYKNLYPFPLHQLTFPILPKHMLEKDKKIEDSKFNKKPIGTGPFVLKDWKPTNEIILKANANYFEGRPSLDGIVFKINPSKAKAKMAMISNKTDMKKIYYSNEYKEQYKEERFWKISSPSMEYLFIALNHKSRLFNSPDIRKALSYAINIEELMKIFFDGQGRIISAPIPHFALEPKFITTLKSSRTLQTTQWFRNPNIKQIKYDQKKSKEILKNLGWKDTDGDGIIEKGGKDFRFTLMIPKNDPVKIGVAQHIKRLWKRIGIALDIKTYSKATLKQRIFKREYDACLMQRRFRYYPNLYKNWHSSQIKIGGNLTCFNCPALDILIERNNEVYDINKRKNILLKIHSLFVEEQPCLFLFQKYDTYAISKRIVTKIFIKGKEQSFSSPKIFAGDPLYFAKYWFAPGEEVEIN